MLYHIDWRPDTVGVHHQMGGCGFSVQLWPAWKDEIARMMSPDAKPCMGQAAADIFAATTGAKILDMHWPGATDRLKSMTIDDIRAHPARAAAAVAADLRISWGEWGFENIAVRGNACGLDISHYGTDRPANGQVLYPHNVDNLKQASVLLSVFSWLADGVRLQVQCRGEQPVCSPIRTCTNDNPHSPDA